MVRRKRKLKKKVKVIFIILFIIIIIGGISIFMLLNKKLDNEEDNVKQKEVTTSNVEKNDEDISANLESAPQNTGEFSSLEDGDYITEKGYTLTIKNGLSYIDGNLIVNKTYSLPETYKPEDPYTEIGEAAENVLEGADLFALKKGKSPQFGLCISSNHDKFHLEISTNNFMWLKNNLAFLSKNGYTEFMINERITSL